MSDGFSPIKQVCICGHDKATHYPDEQRTTDRGIIITIHGACLGMRCDCHGYDDALTAEPTTSTITPLAPKPTKAPRRPHADLTCKCPGCDAYDRPWARSVIAVGKRVRLRVGLFRGHEGIVMGPSTTLPGKWWIGVDGVSGPELCDPSDVDVL